MATYNNLDSEKLKTQCTCVLFLLLMAANVKSSSVISDDVKSLIYAFQHRYCGRDFCYQDPTYLPPLCPYSSYDKTMNGSMKESDGMVNETSNDLTNDTNTRTRTNASIIVHPGQQARQGCSPCSMCKCDAACVIYGDCCVDKHIGSKFIFNCKYVVLFKNDNKTETTPFLIVNTCPTDSPSYSKDLAYRCEHGQLGHIQDGRQVTAPYAYGTSVTFRNKYCAMCYDIINYTPWKVFLTCNKDFDASNYTDINSLIRSLTATPNCSVAYRYPADSNLRKCDMPQRMVSVCNVTGKWQKYNKTTQQACHSYYNPTVFKDYRNIFCYLCNGESQSELECPSVCTSNRFKPLVIVNFAALLNFENSDVEVVTGATKRSPIKRIGEQEARQCRDRDVYDIQSRKCREIYCPLVERYDSSTCVKLVPSGGHVLTTWNLTVQYVDDVLFTLSSPRLHFGIAVLHELQTVLSKWGFTLSGGLATDYATINTMHNLRLNESKLQTILLLKSNFSLEMSRKELVAVKNIFLNITRQGQRVEVDIQPRHNDHNMNGKLVVAALGIPFIHSQIHGRSRSPSTIEVPLYFNVSCPMLRFDDHEVSIEKNNVILHGHALLGKDEYFIRKSEYFICLDAALRGKLREYTALSVNSSYAILTEQIITGISLSCSLLFLLMTMLVYILIKELHTLPGLNLILLTSSLFVAQAFYLFGAGTVTTPTICTVIGVLIHYFWLVAFAWMNVCCLHMFRVFTSLCTSLDFTDNKTSTVVKYAALAYGIPLIIVGATLVTTYITSDYTRVAYGGTTLCFVERGLASIISFGIPAGFTVLTNTVFLIITTLHLKQTRLGIRSFRKSETNDICKFFKLSTISGLSWVFGFLGYFLQRNELLYVFTVLTAGQGVFIFLSFAASKRILRLARNRCACKIDSKKILKTTSGVNKRCQSLPSVSQKTMDTKM